MCVSKTADGYNVTRKSVRVVYVKSGKAVAATPPSGQWRFIASAFIPPRRVYSRHRICRLRRHFITPLYCGTYNIIIIIIASIYNSAKYNNNNGLMVSYYTYLRHTHIYIYIIRIIQTVLYIECPDFKISRFCEFRSLQLNYLF